MKLLLLPLLAGLAAAATVPAPKYPTTLTMVRTVTVTFGVAPTTTPFSGFPVEVLETTMTITTLQPFESAPTSWPCTVVETIISDIRATTVLYVNPSPRTTYGSTLTTTTATVLLRPSPSTHTASTEEEVEEGQGSPVTGRAAARRALARHQNRYRQQRQGFGSGSLLR